MMKRVLLTLLLMTLLFNFSCTSQPPVNDNRNSTIGSNTNANANAGAMRERTTLKVQLDVHYAPGTPPRVTIDGPHSNDPEYTPGGPISMFLGDSINWKVRYRPQGTNPPQVKVIIDNFRDMKQGAGGMNPFGNMPDHNIFDTGFITAGNPEVEKPSKEANKMGAFKYAIHVQVGTTMRVTIDPMVVISGGLEKKSGSQ